MTLSREERETILRSKLFAEIQPEQLDTLLSCLGAELREYEPGSWVIQEGERVTEVGLVLTGNARSLKLDGDAEPLIISLLERGSFLGVLLAASRNHRSPVCVQAQSPLRVLFLSAAQLITPCKDGCADHTILLRNFLDSVAEQSLSLNDRIGCLVQPTVRKKVCAYLTRLSEEKGTREFTIPLDRSAMANYLNVERSALSRELSHMKADGLIEYRMNRFRLLSL